MDKNPQKQARTTPPFSYLYNKKRPWLIHITQGLNTKTKLTTKKT